MPDGRPSRMGSRRPPARDAHDQISLRQTSRSISRPLAIPIAVSLPLIALTILGVILFLRMGWVVGNVGLMPALMIVTLCHLITLATTLS